MIDFTYPYGYVLCLALILLAFYATFEKFYYLAVLALALALQVASFYS